MILDLMQFLQNKDHQHLKWQQQKSWISYPDRQGAQDKELMQYLLFPMSKWKMLQKENTQIGMSRHLDSSTTTQMAQIMVQFGRSSRSSWVKSVRSSFGRTGMGKAIWENPIEVRLGESFQLGMLIRTPWRGIILICVCGWHQTGWKETKYWSDVESTKQRSWFGRTNIIPWTCVPGMYSKTLWNKQRCCWQVQNHVWIKNFRRRNWKNYHARKICVFLPRIWRNMPRNVWNDIVSWQTRRLNNSTNYLHASLTIISMRKNWKL